MKCIVLALQTLNRSILAEGISGLEKGTSGWKCGPFVSLSYSNLNQRREYFRELHLSSAWQLVRK